MSEHPASNQIHELRVMASGMAGNVDEADDHSEVKLLRWAAAEIERLRDALESIYTRGTPHSVEWEIAKTARCGLPDETTGFRCKANRTADPPQDCDWPNCGCDEKATEVIESLVEQGWMPVPRSASMPKRERPQESPSKSKFDYIEELASYCGFVPTLALYGLVRSRQLEALLEHLANAQDDVLRLHHAYVDLKYPQTARSPEEPSLPIASSEGTIGYPPCFFCGRSIEDHRSIHTGHPWREGSRVTDHDLEKSRLYFAVKATASPIPPGRMCNTHGNWNCSECCPPENGSEANKGE